MSSSMIQDRDVMNWGDILHYFPKLTDLEIQLIRAQVTADVSFKYILHSCSILNNLQNLSINLTGNPI